MLYFKIEGYKALLMEGQERRETAGKRNWRLPIGRTPYSMMLMILPKEILNPRIISSSNRYSLNKLTIFDNQNTIRGHDQHSFTLAQNVNYCHICIRE